MPDRKSDRVPPKATAQRKPLKPQPAAAGPQAAAPMRNSAQALANPMSTSPEAMLQLQRAYGNRAVQRLIDESVQRAAPVGAEGGSVEGSLQSQIESARGGGQPLDKTAGAHIGGALGADFSGVRVHTGRQADTLNRSMSAKAFTLGSDIFFSQGSYSPGSSGGKQLLAHELTHVVQQGGAGVSAQGGGKTNRVQTKLTVGAAGDAFEQEADRVAAQVMTRPAQTTAPEKEGAAGKVQRHGAHASPGGPAPTVQVDEEFVQRKSAPIQVSQMGTQQAGIQREIIADWKTESTVKNMIGIKKPRSKLLKGVDLAVETFKTTPMGLFDQRVLAALVVQAAVERWRRSKGDRATIRDAKIKELVDEVGEQARLAREAKEQRRLDMEVAQVEFGKFSTYEPDLEPYAGRSTDIKAERFTPGSNPEGSINELLTRPRGPNGALTPETVLAFVGNDQIKYLQPALQKGREGSLTAPKDITVEQVKEVMLKYQNEHTGATAYPELENLAKPNGGEDKDITETRDADGVSVEVTYNLSDANFALRWGLVEAAITKVKTAGFAVPSIKLYLPKFGRQISVTPSEGHTHLISEDNDSEAAMFVTPNNIYLNSRTYNNPKVATGLSIQLDPLGVATMIHEIGHFLHFTNAPTKFYGLSLSILKGTVPGENGERLVSYAKRIISDYGSNNPREFVAEILLGLSYNKAFPDYALKVYKILGGPIPRGQEAKFNTLTDETELPKEK